MAMQRRLAAADTNLRRVLDLVRLLGCFCGLLCCHQYGCRWWYTIVQYALFELEKNHKRVVFVFRVLAPVSAIDLPKFAEWLTRGSATHR